VLSIERRDRTLAMLRDRAARRSRAESLTTAVAGAAHELSSPLATIAVASRELELHLRDRPDLGNLVGDAQLIRAQVDRCRELLDQMALRMASPMGEAPRTADLRDILDEVVAGVGNDHRARIAITISTARDVRWPVGVVRQALANLVRNALQASPAGAPVRIDVRGDARNVRIAVVDRGAGMAPDVLARAGEPFFTTKPPGAGMGLGLFVTRSAIESLRGDLSIASRPGEETSATVTLPRDVVETPGVS
jgi:two-component system sensor histidine kinase RegB